MSSIAPSKRGAVRAPATTPFRPTKVRYYLDAMNARGLSTTQVLRGCSIDIKRLDDPSYFVDINQFDVLIGNMLDLSEEPSLGLQIGMHSNLGDYGLVGFAITSATTVRHACVLWNRFVDLIGMPPFQFKETSRNTTLSIASRPRPTRVDRFCTEEYLMTFRMLGSVLVGYRPVLERCALPYDPPAYHELYTQHFGCPVVFNAPEASITITSPKWSARVRGNDPEINALCVRRCTQQMRELNGHGGLSSRLRRQLLATADRFPTLDEAAAQLGISARSLHRHLASEGCTYRALTESVRLELAREYLKAEQLPVKEVGYLLGFESANSFRKAFKAWSGQTVGDFVRGKT